MEKIIIGKNLLKKIDHLFDFGRFSKIAVLTDENIRISLMSQISQIKNSLNRELSMITIPPGEKSKNIKTVKIIWKKMFEAGLDRKSLLINFGGGVVCDMGGFAASTFMRGIEFINIPTTLLSQVDASVGGKVGIDFNQIKNAIGVFQKPAVVIIDVETLKTLPQRELISAFAEIIKHGIIDSQAHFDMVTAKKPTEFNQKELIEIIKKSVQLKSKIVKKDFKEATGLRKTLNFGHTIGHAIESLSWKTNKPLLHGEAVAIGMVAESKLACLCQPVRTSEVRTRVAEQIKRAIVKAGLPVKIENIKSEDILKTILSDKKNSSGKVNWSLPKRIGKVLINVEVPDDLVVKAIKSIII